MFREKSIGISDTKNSKTNYYVTCALERQWYVHFSHWYFHFIRWHLNFTHWHIHFMCWYLHFPHWYFISFLDMFTSPVDISVLFHWNANTMIRIGTATTQNKYIEVLGSHSDMITNCSFQRESLSRSGTSKTTWNKKININW